MGRLADPVPRDLRPLVEAGLPGGTLTHCTGLALASASLAGPGVRVSELGVAVQLRLPEVMAASYGSGFRMAPAPPRRAPGGGWYHADLGAVGDASLFESMLSTLPPAATARQVAETAQEWRLAVCDYRPRPRPGARARRVRGQGRALRGMRVCDLTAMWAGPLATWLLQGLGACVTKIEPARRPDGFRALDGRGIHPGGRQVDPGRDSAMFNALNAGKAIAALDLTKVEDRAGFLDLASGSDLVVDSFSPRVWGNLGLDLGARPLHLSMPAFPPGPLRSWVAYGTGVHAASGLGDSGGGRFEAPAVSYPDPVGGFAGCLAALTGWAAGERGPLEASLLSSVTPLLGWPPGMAARDDEVGPALLEAGIHAGALRPETVAGRRVWHPVPPWRW
jgi:hypothetical protein